MPSPKKKIIAFLLIWDYIPILSYSVPVHSFGFFKDF